MKIAFVCVQNAGRSQMATAFARREKEERGLDVEVISGGTDPADEVHPGVRTIMNDINFDLSNQRPTKIRPEDIERCDVVVTMGCGADGVCPASWTGEVRDWNLEDPDGRDRDARRRIRNDIRDRVGRLFDELERNTG